MGEVLFIIGLILFLVFPFALLNGKGRIFWMITMGTIGLTVGLAELISHQTTGITISRHFWNWSELHPMTAWIVLGLLLIGWLILLVHLAWRILGYGKKKNL